MDTPSSKYEKAKKRVEEIKGFYTHLAVYLIINVLLLLFNLGVFQNGWINLHIPSWSLFTTPFFWGIGLLGHGLYVFGGGIRFYKNWEERKLRQFMEEEESALNHTVTQSNEKTDIGKG
ncbi:MAG: hypothetical protein CMC08_01000 [Flavobacteriaceae bacterium]|nr:hypothetical protein [Flavobacteriaceae bacterium]|tara:strand:- start:136 stop:492 length:357 start_codon:yes stop_codon:yes gene_type:complete